jgi:hypothetical protein
MQRPQGGAAARRGAGGTSSERRSSAVLLTPMRWSPRNAPPPREAL